MDGSCVDLTVTLLSRLGSISCTMGHPTYIVLDIIGARSGHRDVLINALWPGSRECT